MDKNEMDKSEMKIRERMNKWKGQVDGWKEQVDK